MVSLDFQPLLREALELHLSEEGGNNLLLAYPGIPASWATLGGGGFTFPGKNAGAAGAPVEAAGDLEPDLF